MSVTFIRNRLLSEFTHVSGDEQAARFVAVIEADRQLNTRGIRNPNTPDDAFSDDEELALASHYPQSSLAQLVAWGAMNESTHKRQTLSDLDGDTDLW